MPNCLPQYWQRYSRTGADFGESSDAVAGGGRDGGSVQAPHGGSKPPAVAGSAEGGRWIDIGGVIDRSCCRKSNCRLFYWLLRNIYD